jgi:hypothetical protein
MKTILTRLIFVTIVSQLIFSCAPSLPTGETTVFGKADLAKFWTLKDTVSENEEITLTKIFSEISSKFNVRNFEFSVKLKTSEGAEGLVAFHSGVGTEGNLTKGYLVTINNSDYSTGNPQKTGSLTLIRNNFVNTAKDGEWFDLSVVVVANHIKVSVKGYVVTEYIEPENPKRLTNVATRLLSEGKIVIRKTSDAGKIEVGEMTIKPLDKELPRKVSVSGSDDIAQAIDSLNLVGFPLIDFHGHLKGGLTMEQAREHARLNGFNYGIAANCGLKFPVTNDSTLNAYLDGISAEPVFKVMQAEGREWVTLFSPEAVARFDYIFTDAMTWTDHKGRRMRLWMPDETFVDNDQQFMDMLTGKIEAVMSAEPVDIYVNPTFLPKQLEEQYDSLWTVERMDRVINVLKNNQVALEINARYRIPSIEFLKRAKAAGVKFTFGTNNTKNDDLFRLEYCIEAIRKVGITADDIFLPRAKSERKVLKMGLPSKITG